MKRRITALALCLTILVSTFSFVFQYISFPTVAAEEPVSKSVRITKDGKEINELILPENDKVYLTAETEGMENPTFQWQILYDSEKGIWVNIYDKTEQKCEMSYAVVKNVLDDAKGSCIRCRVLDDGQTYTTAPLAVTVLPELYTTDVSQHSTEESAADLKSAPKRASLKAARAADDGAGADEKEYVTITINYLDFGSKETGEERPIYTPYVATIEKGTDISQNVISPSYIGFAPFYAADPEHPEDIKDSAAIIKLTYQNVTDDIVINVYYKAQAVRYAIRYFFQNINDDLYTEDVSLYFVGEAETGTIITDKDIKNHAGDTTGFAQMYHVPDSVAADGSTVFECYYDRIYSLIRFDLDGGYGTDPIYARYGTPYIVNEPLRSGYVFKGWDKYLKDTTGDGEFDKGDKQPDEIPGIIGPENEMYGALWERANTTYIRNYFATMADGSIRYLGAIRTDAKTGDKIIRNDDLEQKYDLIFAFEMHVHTIEDGCYGNCKFKDHVHTIKCYSSQTLTLGEAATDNNWYNDMAASAYKELTEKVSSPVYGYVYRYMYSAKVYDFAYLAGNWYYLGYRSSDVSYDIKQEPTKDGTYIMTEAILTISCEMSRHKHEDSCLTCTKLAHIHDENCNRNPRYYVYDGQKNQDEPGAEITVEGDGSSALNIYYKPKEYTLRFIYARSSNDHNKDTGKKYEVVGGSTWPFSGYNHTSEVSEDTKLKTLLGWVPDNNWGEVKDLPKFYENYQLSGSTSDTGNYTLGKIEPENNETYTYYYFDFKASYDEDISTKWPIGILAPAKITKKHYHSYKYTDSDGNVQEGVIEENDDYEYAYFSAWNGEYKVKYTQDRLKGVDGDTNLTIKGRIMKLGERILYDKKFKDGDVVNFLGFWENGADVPWSVPMLFQHHLMLEVPKTTIITGNGTGENITVTENGVSLTTDRIFVADENEFIPGEFEKKEYTMDDGQKGVIYVNNYDRIFRKYGDKYYEQWQSIRSFDDSEVSSQTAPAIDGFTHAADARTWKLRDEGYTSFTGETLKYAYDVYFYYSRNEYSFTRFNYENQLTTKLVPYEQSLNSSDYNFDPSRYPPSLEPGAYKFDGWYTSPARIHKIDFTTYQMPAQNVVIYAKWVPVQHTVNFFTSYEEMLRYENDQEVDLFYCQTLEHGNVVGSVDEPEKAGEGDLQLFFVGWFYIENGEKKAFTPTNMPISRDMNIFADWSSSQPQPYRIEYKLLDTNETIAEPTTGYAYGGTTRTFTAKAGNPSNQLFEGYNKGYYPIVATHSVTISAEDDNKNPTQNVYTFYYKKSENVKYTVRYLDKQTGLPVADEKIVSTTDAIVTERFQTVPDMVPDAFYKRLVLTTLDDAGNSPENVITFYYTPNNTSAFYAVHFMLEKPGATETQKANYQIDGTGGYAEAGTHFEGTGNLGSNISVNPQNFIGFKLIDDKSVSIVSGDKDNQTPVDYKYGHYIITVTAGGTELYIFYSRLSYEYEVRYLEYGTGKTLAGPIVGTSPYESTVTENAKKIAGYTCVSKAEQSITIRPYSNTDGTQNPNVIIFYYAPMQFAIKYIAVPENGGTLSQSQEVITGDATIDGCVATAGRYFRFVGWYTDEACTNPVTDENGTLSPDQREFIPNNAKLSDTEDNIFYAKFERLSQDLEIVRENTTANDNQVFVYEIKNTENGETITLTIVGDGDVTIKDLPCGNYTVTQKSGWSWRYDDPSQTFDHLSESDVTVVRYTKQESNDKWLNGNSELLHNDKEET